jgi:hypothetical protein
MRFRSHEFMDRIAPAPQGRAPAKGGPRRPGPQRPELLDVLKDRPDHHVVLDYAEPVHREPLEGPRLTPEEIVDYTRSLPRLWEESGSGGRQALVVAIFARLNVLGFKRLEYELTTNAVDLGLDAAMPPVMDLGSQIDEFGRGERT